MKFTEIKIAGLKNGDHTFHFDLNFSFLTGFSSDFFDKPEIGVTVDLVLSETMVKSTLKLEGTVELVCDRSLETFRYPVVLEEVHFFKFGLEEKELSDEIEVIVKERVSIDFDQLVYDLVALSIPSKRLHPKFQVEEDNEEEGKLIFSTVDSAELIETSPDPRWAKLTELND